MTLPMVLSKNFDRNLQRRHMIRTEYDLLSDLMLEKCPSSWAGQELLLLNTIVTTTQNWIMGAMAGMTLSGYVGLCSLPWYLRAILTKSPEGNEESHLAGPANAVLGRN